MKWYCLIQTEKTPCQYLLYRNKYAQISIAESGTEPLPNSRKHNAGKMKTWMKSHSSTRLFQTKVCTTNNIHLHCVYTYIHTNTYIYTHILSCVYLLSPCPCTLYLLSHSPCPRERQGTTGFLQPSTNYHLGNQFWHFGQNPFPQHNPAASTHSVLMPFYTVPTFLSHGD